MAAIQPKEQASSPRQSWQIGDVKVTKFVDCIEAHDLARIFTTATRADVLAIPWLRPHFITPEGLGLMSFHALVVDTPSKRIIVDTCWGDEKDRGPWKERSNLQTSFLKDLEGAGYSRESFDVVLCTHLHADHVGWNTMLVDGKWIPTFPNARYILNKAEFEFWMDPYGLPSGDGYDKVQELTILDSVKPVHAAGLVDLVEGAHKVCDEVTLLPTPGHTAGHVSVHISSRGEEAIITGDMTHHPSQLVHPEWGLKEDFDFAQAKKSRERLYSDVADKPVLIIGTHWAGVTAGKIKRDRDVYRLQYD
jgi:glyoxylase-like metal-dependent hydrolase (beta-lactamase superfamily II)